MLPATQLQKDTPPETTCDAHALLVISRDITSRQSFVARRRVWAGAANTQHMHRLHCIVSTSRAWSQMMQGKLTQWRDVDTWWSSLWLLLLAFKRHCNARIWLPLPSCYISLVVSSLCFVNQWMHRKRPDSYYDILLLIFGLSEIELKLVVGLNFTVTGRSWVTWTCIISLVQQQFTRQLITAHVQVITSMLPPHTSAAHFKETCMSLQPWHEANEYTVTQSPGHIIVIGGSGSTWKDAAGCEHGSDHQKWTLLSIQSACQSDLSSSVNPRYRETWPSTGVPGTLHTMA